jgi:hypothetical protein
MEEPELDTVGMVTHIPAGMVKRIVVIHEPVWVASQ